MADKDTKKIEELLIRAIENITKQMFTKGATPEIDPTISAELKKISNSTSVTVEQLEKLIGTSLNPKQVDIITDLLAETKIIKKEDVERNRIVNKLYQDVYRYNKDASAKLALISRKTGIASDLQNKANKLSSKFSDFYRSNTMWQMAGKGIAGGLSKTASFAGLTALPNWLDSVSKGNQEQIDAIRNTYTELRNKGVKKEDINEMLQEMGAFGGNLKKIENATYTAEKEFANNMKADFRRLAADLVRADYQLSDEQKETGKNLSEKVQSLLDNAKERGFVNEEIYELIKDTETESGKQLLRLIELQNKELFNSNKEEIRDNRIITELEESNKIAKLDAENLELWNQRQSKIKPAKGTGLGEGFGIKDAISDILGPTIANILTKGLGKLFAGAGILTALKSIFPRILSSIIMPAITALGGAALLPLLAGVGIVGAAGGLFAWAANKRETTDVNIQEELRKKNTEFYGKNAPFKIDELNKLQNMLLPGVKGATVTSPLGYRIDPVKGGIALHRGTDVAAPEGSPISAAEEGVITRAESNSKGGFGNVIEITSADGYTTRYAHLASIPKTVVSGSLAKKGQFIGTVGKTGKTTGPVLHFERFKRGVSPVEAVKGLINNQQSSLTSAVETLSSIIKENSQKNEKAQPINIMTPAIRSMEAIPDDIAKIAMTNFMVHYG